MVQLGQKGANMYVLVNFTFDCDRELWNVVVIGGGSAERNFAGPEMGHLGPILAQGRDLDQFSWFWQIRFVLYCIKW